MTNKKIFVASLTFSLLLIFLTEPATYSFHKGMFNIYESSILEPLFFFITSISISSFVLLFFRNQIFRLWLKRFMVWFVPVSVLIIASGSVEISYAWPTRTSLAINMGVIMTIATLLFALVQRFYYKIK